MTLSRLDFFQFILVFADDRTTVRLTMSEVPMVFRTVFLTPLKAFYAIIRFYKLSYAFICFYTLLYAFICFYMLYTCFKSKCVTTRRTTTRPRVTRLPALPAEAGKNVEYS